MLDGRPYGLPEFVRVVAVLGQRGETVIAAVSYGAVSNSLETVAHALLFGTPALFLLMTWVIWLITGSTLRPISGLRRGAEQVTATGVPRGLPVPEARDEVHSLAVTLNDMLSRLEAAQQRQRRLVSDTAHELRSPIASIRAQLEVALDHPDSQVWEQTARDVLADTLRLARLAEDLLVLARLEERAGQAAARAPGPLGGTVDLADLATATVAGYGQARVPVSVDPVSVNPVSVNPVSAPGVFPVSGDADGLRRMLVNLIDNAVRYAAERVRVRVTADGESSGELWALLTVTDDGPGIPPHSLERAFDRFTMLDDARARGSDTGGAGLGLAIVRATAIAHGGTAWLENAGPGLRAVVRLPLGDPPHA